MAESLLETNPAYPAANRIKSNIVNKNLPLLINRQQSRQALDSGQPENFFLDELRQEMDMQRLSLKDEVDKLCAGSPDKNGHGTDSPDDGDGKSRRSKSEGSADNSVQFTEPSTFVYRPNGDSSPAIFCALVDVSEYHDGEVTVTYDDQADQLVVFAEKLDDSRRHVLKTFTQRIKMPRFADHSRMRCRKRRDHLLAVEVPLLFFFPEDFNLERRKAKSFINGVRTHRDGRQSLEILVNPGADFTSNDLQIKVDRETNKLVVFACHSTPGVSGSFSTTVIKQYSLNEQADVDRISTRLCKDGRLAISIPIKRKFKTPSTPTSPTEDKNCNGLSSTEAGRT